MLAAAAAVLVASASGALRPRSAEAAARPATAGTSAPSTKRRSRPSMAPAKPRRHSPATLLTQLPPANVADPTRGVAIRLNGSPGPHTPRPKLTPQVAGSWTDVGSYEFFRPVSTLEPCTTYSLEIPAGRSRSATARSAQARERSPSR